MSLSECTKCGGFIPLGPEASNCCETCGAFVFDSPSTTTNKYLIWSFEHNAWWKYASNGYTAVRAEAGRYNKEDAINICTEANQFSKNVNPEEAMVPEY